jgi:hypothetical protein
VAGKIRKEQQRRRNAGAPAPAPDWATVHRPGYHHRGVLPIFKGPIGMDAEGSMRKLVLNNQVICGTVNVGRASFDGGLRDPGSFRRHFPDAVRVLIIARVSLEDAREPVLSRGGIKSVVTFA